MKIVWICSLSPVYYKDQAGLDRDWSSVHPATWLYFLSEEIKKFREVDLHIISPVSNLDKDVIFKQENITYYFLSPGKWMSKNKVINFLLSFQRLYCNLFYFDRKIRRIIRATDPDLVTAHGTEVHANHLRFLKYPSVIWMQGIINQVAQDQKGFWIDRLKKREIKSIRSQTNFITIPSNIESFLLSYNRNCRFFHSFYPVNPYCFTIADEDFPYVNDLIFVGAISKKKGIEDLLMALSLLKNRKNDFKVKIIGNYETGYLEKIKGMISEFSLVENIVFLGFIQDHDEVIREIKQSRIFVLPTHVDTGPRSVAEASAIGTAVISYNIDGLPLMINNNETGILVEKGDVESLKNAILQLLDDEDKRKKMAENGRKYAQNNYDGQAIAARLIRYYKEVLDQENT